MAVSKEKKQEYIDSIYEEMEHRGLSKKEIKYVIGKTGFMIVMQEYPEEQMHYSISDAVDEILLVAAKH